MIFNGSEGLDVVIGQDVSDEALQVLCGMDLSALKRGSLAWDEEQKKWVFYGPPKGLGWLRFLRRNR